MQKMIATQTQTAEADIQLAALSSAGKPIPAKPSKTSQTSPSDDFAPPRASLSDSYDPEICTANVRIIPGKPTSSKSLRLRIRDIQSNKIARRSFLAMLILGTITILYQFISLVPAFQEALAVSQGLHIQVKGETDSRQNLAYGFLAECANRRSQNLPLGPDCQKYLTMTPKAPPDIDKWMIDPPASNTSTPLLTTRSIALSLRQLNQSLSITTSETAKTSSFWPAALYDLNFWAVFGGILLLYLGLWGVLRKSNKHKELAGWIQNNVEALIGREMAWYVIRTWMVCWLVLVLYAFISGWSSSQKLKSWSAASEFLESCKTQQGLDLPLGDDCLAYLGKELKPPPRLTLSEILGVVGGVTGFVTLLPPLLSLIAYIRVRWRRRSEITLGDYVPVTRRYVESENPVIRTTAQIRSESRLGETPS